MSTFVKKLYQISILEKWIMLQKEEVSCSIVKDKLKQVTKQIINGTKSQSLKAYCLIVKK